MSSTPTENLPTKLLESELLPSKADQALLPCWQKLPLDKKKFVVAYLESSYSLQGAASLLQKSKAECNTYLGNPNVRRAITEVQSTLDSVDFLNEKWVKAQLLRIFPMVMGDEPVPMVTQMGEEYDARKFFPDIAMKIVEYVAPRKTVPTVAVNINNINRLSDDDLERIAAANTRVIDVE